jgi:hypothetical protein
MIQYSGNFPGSSWSVCPHNPATYDYTRSKLYQLYKAVLMSLNLVIAGFFTYFNRYVVWVTITMLNATLFITFSHYMQFFFRTRN